MSNVVLGALENVRKASLCRASAVFSCFDTSTTCSSSYYQKTYVYCVYTAMSCVPSVVNKHAKRRINWLFWLNLILGIYNQCLHVLRVARHKTYGYMGLCTSNRCTKQRCIRRSIYSI